jgi:hypothetical protein
VVEDADRKDQKLLWDAALEKMGRDTVRIRLIQMSEDRSTTFKLPDQPGCKRGYAEDWLARMEVEDRARANRAETVETKRFHYIFWPALLAALAAVWFVVRDVIQ